MKKSGHPNSFRTRFSKDIVAEVLFPVRQTGKVAIMAIGAPSAPYKKETLRFLASHGYVVIFPRYRGTWESEGNFLEKSPAKDIEDVVTELAKKRAVYDIATREKKLIRVSAVHLFGGSFGGPAVLLNTWQPIVKKVIALSPVIDWSKRGRMNPLTLSSAILAKVMAELFAPSIKKIGKNFSKRIFIIPLNIPLPSMAKKSSLSIAKMIPMYRMNQSFRLPKKPEPHII